MVASSWPDFLEKAKGQGTVEVQAFDKKVYMAKINQDFRMLIREKVNSRFML